MQLFKLGFELIDLQWQIVKLVFLLERQLAGTFFLRLAFAGFLFFGRLHGWLRSLLQPVIVAADVLPDPAVSFKGNRAGDNPVEKIPIVAHQEECSLEVGE